MKPGDIVYGTITNIVGYGAFAKVDIYDGLIHISEFSDNFVKSIEDYVTIGEEVRLRGLEVDEINQRVRLGYKQNHKTRGVKCKVPTYVVGYKPIKDQMDTWIKEYEVRLKNETTNSQTK